jgi:isopenicillin-N N-acyltransferase-like protein
LNLRSEIVYTIKAGGKVFETPEEGCTTLAATPEATLSGHMLIGQNVDWLLETKDTYILLKEKRDKGPNSIMLLEAGTVGRSTGLNSAKVARCGNGLFTDRIGLGVPMMIVDRKLSTAENIAEAIAMAVSPLPPKRSGSVNRAIADPSGLCVSIEVTPEDAIFIWPSDGILVHTNHFLTPHENVRDLGSLLFPGSLIKKYRSEMLLTAERGKITVETIQKIFRDHAGKPASVCYHVGSVVTSQTVASIIIDVNDKKLFVAKGLPCENEYVPLTFNDIM